MNAITRTWSLWHRSRSVAACLTTLEKCPCCHTSGPELLFNSNDLAPKLYLDRRLTRGKYSLCHQCGVVSAAVRPRAEAASVYYALFPEVENKSHGIYPPPNRFSAGKMRTADDVIAILDARGLLKPDVSILHVRCDAGTLLEALRNRLPNATLHGVDYFETNVRYIREMGFAEASPFSAAGLQVPYNTSYDIVLSNHVLTHSLDPLSDLRAMRAVVKDTGYVLFYNENDHDLLFDTQSPLFTRMDVINYHQQLFIRESFETFVRSVGLAPEFLGHRGFTMVHLAAVDPNGGSAAAIPPAVVEREKNMVRAWHKIAEHNRYLLPLAKTLKSYPRLGWLERRLREKTIGAPKKASKKKPSKDSKTIKADKKDKAKDRETLSAGPL